MRLWWSAGKGGGKSLLAWATATNALENPTRGHFYVTATSSGFCKNWETLAGL